MPTIEGAIITEQGVTFAVAIVRPSTLNSPPECESAIRAFSAVFGGLPTIIMAQDSQGVPSYYGRRDLVDFMASVPLEAVSWSRYQVN
ncbi:MAG TPA: hypothetical protein VGW98_10185 [Solirubrobacteraceae bacterium]|jgi:hypothetical protein|nr:hypothetical protein [Solirubrobacteraceae bacterium]